jgi:hypothetical protein
MIQRTGIFAGLRRRRWALSLAFGYALFLNALLGTSVEGALAASSGDPLVAAAAPLCAGEQPPASPRHAPADHQQTCPLCGPACPMTGCAPLDLGTATAALGAPARLASTPIAWSRGSPAGTRRLYASDMDSQGPPAA